MPTIDFTYSARSMSPRTLAEYLSTVVPLRGKADDPRRGLVAKMRWIRARWQMRGAELLKAGWSCIDSKKFMYARNCPPCCVNSTPQACPCSLRICPFCFGRSVARRYEQLRLLIARQPYSVKVMSYRAFHGHRAGEVVPIFFDEDGGLTQTYGPILKAHLAVRHAFRRKRIPDAIGGIYWYASAPVAYDSLPDDGCAGKWLCQHSCIAVVPNTWEKPDDMPGDTRLVENPDDFQLAKLVAHAFRYPHRWLYANAAVMTALLELSKGARFCTTFGQIRGINE